MTVYDELSRVELVHGYKIVGKFTDETTGITRRMRFFVDSPAPSQQEIDDKINEIKDDVEFSYNPLNRYKLSGGVVKPKLLYIVQYVRDASSCTRIELIGAVNAEFPGMLWKPAKLLTNIETHLEEKLDITQTFDEFKIYLIDHKFRGLD